MSGRIQIIVAAIFLILISFASIYGEEIKTEVLQYKMNRLYFPYGQESNIIEKCPYKLLIADDSIVHTGQIEASYTGVSYTYPVDDSLFRLPDSPICLIETAVVDSSNFLIATAPENIISIPMPELDGINKSAWDMLAGYMLLYPDNFQKAPGLGKNIFPPRPALPDIWLSLRRIDNLTGDLSHYNGWYKSPASFFAVLIPNPSKPFNKKGLLTTSLYYRFNNAFSYVYFPENETEPFNALWLSNDSAQRIYDYDPGQGQKLMRIIDNLPARLNIGIGHQSLERLYDYYADILSRDRIRAENDSSKTFDVYLDYILIDQSDPGKSLRIIYDRLTSDTVPGMKINETIKTIGKYIELGDNASNQSKSARYYNLAARSLTEDIGVFPLFRPTLYHAFHEDIRGIETDSNANLISVNIRKLKLPQITEQP